MNEHDRRTDVEPSTAAQIAAGALRAELLKLRKRPAVWVLAAILLVAIGLFGYLFSYTLVAGGQDVAGMDRGAVLASLLPAEVVTTVLGQLGGFGIPIALIFATLVVGSEYGWGTMKTVAVQRPGRGALLSAKFLALAFALAGLVVLAFVFGWIGSLAVASVEGAPMEGPSIGQVAGGLAAGWLILVPYALLGGMLALVLRRTGLALGLGLVYVLVVENLLLTMPIAERVAEAFAQIGLGPNAFALVQTFGELPTAPQMIARAAPSVGQAVVVLVAYAAVFAAVGALVFRRRPIT